MKLSYDVQIEPISFTKGGRAVHTVYFEDIVLSENYIEFTPRCGGIDATNRQFEHPNGETYFGMVMGKRYHCLLAECQKLLREDKVVIVLNGRIARTTDDREYAKKYLKPRT